MSSNANYFLNNRPAWIDIASPDPAATRDFYSRLFGWDIQVEQDPQYGGYGMAVDSGVGVAGIGPKMDPNVPTAWQLYFGTDDADALSQRVTDNGGKVVMAPFAVGLLIYWTWSNVLTTLQQYVIMRRFKVDNPIDRLLGRLTGK